MKDYSYEYVEFLIDVHLVEKKENMEFARREVMKGLDWALSEQAMVGMDLADITDGLEGCKEIYWAKCNSKEVMDETAMGKALIERAGVEAKECGKIILSYNGDFTLVQMNDVAESVSGEVKEDADIFFAGNIDWDMEDSFDVIALFVV